MQAAFSALAPESQDDAWRNASTGSEFLVTGKKSRGVSARRVGDRSLESYGKNVA
jgi:hypothetical protein